MIGKGGSTIKAIGETSGAQLKLAGRTPDATPEAPRFLVIKGASSRANA